MPDTYAYYTNTAASTAAVTNRFVTTANMANAAYTLAHTTPVWSGGCLVTLTHTTVAGTDTLGTVALVGTDLNGSTISETLTPVADSTVTSTKIYRSITSLTGSGWTATSTADTIVVGCAAGSYAASSSGILGSVVVNTTAAAAVTISDAKGTIATLKSSIAEGTYPFNVAYSGYLKVATTSTNDVTLTHSTTAIPVYATS
jgi:hypothetical protein